MGRKVKATRPDEADDLPCDNGTGGKGNLALVKTREVREPGRASAVTGMMCRRVCGVETRRLCAWVDISVRWAQARTGDTISNHSTALVFQDRKADW